MTKLKCIAVTPYYRESRDVLERCIGSVRRQSVTCEHLLVADGHPVDWLDRTGVRHLRLDRSHGDYGNTPRGLGAMAAVAEGYDAVFFLDADNWLEPSHVEVCLAAAAQTHGDIGLCDYVTSKRIFRRPDETEVPMEEEQGHVDTNCFFFLRGSFHLLSLWITMPRFVSIIGDRVLMSRLNSEVLKSAETGHATVNYLCTWPLMYVGIGEPVPEGLDPQKCLDVAPVTRALAALSPREREIMVRMLGGMTLEI